MQRLEYVRSYNILMYYFFEPFTAVNPVRHVMLKMRCVELPKKLYGFYKCYILFLCNKHYRSSVL